MNLRTRLRLPKEHGAWAMLLVPMAAGALLSRTFSVRLVLLVLSSTLLFISREPLLAWLRARKRRRESGDAARTLVVYLAGAFVLGAPLIFYYRLFALIPMIVGAGILELVNARQATKNIERTIAGESLAIIGLTMTAPAAFYAARGEWEDVALWLWALCALYFASSIYYVKLRVASLYSRQTADRSAAWRRCAIYHGFLTALLLLGAFTGNLRWFALVAFAPVLLRSFAQLIKPAPRLNLRRAGVLEIVYSLVFLIFITLAFRGY